MKTEKIYGYLERIANLLRTDTRRTGVGKGLQPVHLEALHYLNSCNRYSNTPAAVADFLGLTKGTVSQTLGVLENAGLIEKQPDLKDRRVLHLKLTERGRQVIDASIPPQIFHRAMELIDDAGQQALLQDLNKVLSALQQANGLRTFGVCMQCRHHHVETEDLHRCGLTGETLLADAIEKICREHEPPQSG